MRKRKKPSRKSREGNHWLFRKTKRPQDIIDYRYVRAEDRLTDIRKSKAIDRSFESDYIRCADGVYISQRQ